MRLRREKTESRSISASALGEDFWVWTNERDDGSTGLQDHGLLALGPECPYRIHGPEVCGPVVLRSFYWLRGGRGGGNPPGAPPNFFIICCCIMVCMLSY